MLPKLTEYIVCSAKVQPYYSTENPLMAHPACTTWNYPQGDNATDRIEGDVMEEKRSFVPRIVNKNQIVHNDTQDPNEKIGTASICNLHVIDMIMTL